MNTRNRIKTVLSFAVLAMALVGLAATSARAALVLEEHFDYDVGNINGRDGGIGFDGAWAASISHGQIYQTGLVEFASGAGTTVNEDGGLYFSKLPVAGSALSRWGNAGRGQANRLLTTASQTALTGDGTTVWFSVLISATAQQYKNMMFVFGTEAFSHTPGYQLTAVGDGFGVAVAYADGNGDGSINAFVFENSQAATYVKGTFSPVLQSGGTHHDTALIVGKIIWDDGAGSDPNDILELYNVTDRPIQPTTPIATVKADLNQSAFDTIAMYDGTITIIDEIRFATTYNDVVAYDPNAPDVDAGNSWITWSGESVTLDGTITEKSEGWPSLIIDWTSDPDGSDPGVGLDVDIAPNIDPTDPTVTITKVPVIEPFVANGGFEADVLGDGSWDTTPTDWTNGYYDLTAPMVWVVGDSASGVYNPDASQGFGGIAPEGQNVAYTTSYVGYDDGLSQVLSSTLQADTTYELSALVGNPSPYNTWDPNNPTGLTGDYRIELLAGGVLLASDTGPSPVDDTYWTLAGCIYNSGASPAQEGEVLEIRILAVEFEIDATEEYEVDFDDVQLLIDGELGIPILDPNPNDVKLTLTVGCPGKNSVYDSTIITVYPDACQAGLSAGAGITFDPTDFDEDCDTDIDDLRKLAATWLDDYEITAPVAKP